MMRSYLQRLGLFALGFATLVAIGCGPTKTTVKGKVMYKDKPIVWGSVQLVDQAGMYYSGDIDLQGNYSIEGVPPGSVRIGVSSPDPAPKSGSKGGKGAAPTPGAGKGDGGFEDPREKFLREQGGAAGGGDTRPRPPAGAWFPIPRELADPINSGLTGTVESGKPLDIDIKK